MKVAIKRRILFAIIIASLSFITQEKEGISLTVQVDDLRNSKGNAQFTLYNEDGSIPDEKYENYYKILTSQIVEKSVTVTFKNLPTGTYAVNILHDEDKDGEIDKGWIRPTEGIGFSNYKSIGLTNRPKFSKASFNLKENKSIKIKVIYM